MKKQIISNLELNDCEKEKVLILKDLFEKKVDLTEFDQYMKKDFFYFKNLYHGRNTLLEVLNLSSTMSVLEVGSGCGVYTKHLADKVNKLTQIDFSVDRSEVNYLRNASLENVELLVGDYTEVNQYLNSGYDCILFLGILDELRSYQGNFLDLETLIRIYKPFMKKDAILYVAVNNKMGMKYLSGSKDKYDLGYFQSLSIEDKYRYTKKELLEIARKNYMHIETMLYPYPDYLFPVEFFSDEYLPKVGELMEPVSDYECSRLQLFDTGFMYNLLIQEGLFDRFSTSYLVGFALGESEE